MHDTDTVQQWTLWGAVAAAVALLGKGLIAKLNPWALLQRMAESLTGPVMDKRLIPLTAKVDRACRVIDRLPGAEEAHAAIRAEDNKERMNWE